MPMIEPLLEVLTRLEDTLTRRFPRVLRAARLRSGVGSEGLVRLARAMDLKSLPSELQTLWQWHDGQDAFESFLFPGADLGGYIFISTANCLEIVRIARTRGGLEAHYVPVLDGMNGDLAVVDVRDGGLLRWGHDSAPHSYKHFDSLRDFFAWHLAAWESEE